jgi:TrmH family RNA methyltransferase
MNPAPPITRIGSRDNPLLRELRQLGRDSTAYRKTGRIWLEGDHLCRAALVRGLQPVLAVFSESFWPSVPVEWSSIATKIVVLPDALFANVSQLESPARMGYVLSVPAAGGVIEPDAATVILDRLQDAGNVGSILRSASAFGFRQVLALKGTAALWAPKVLRAGMGAHFGLHLVEGVPEAALQDLRVPILVTSSHQGDWIHEAVLPFPCAWALGHEGQGVGEALARRARGAVRIAQPGGEESLNVAAAAAICLHASAIR